MGLCSFKCGILLVSVVPVIIALLLSQCCFLDWVANKLQKPFPHMSSTMWTSKVDSSIRHFEIPNFQSVYDDMVKRLQNSKFTQAVDNLKFHHGVDEDILRDLIKYVTQDITMKKIDEVLSESKGKHYVTTIQGLDVHYLHYKDHLDKNKKTVPLLIIHGWPGSFIEHLESAKLLTDPTYVASKLGRADIQFEVIVPSIPGFVFSQAPPMQYNKTSKSYKIFGFTDASFIFQELMLRLKHDKFIVQGGDWGSIIGQAMARLFPNNVQALHVNFMTLPLQDFRFWLSLLKNKLYPDTNFTEKDAKRYFPVFSKIILDILKKSGYFHIQATRPDSIGVAMTDSPVGHFAYIFEKLVLATKNDPNMNFEEAKRLLPKARFDKLLVNMVLYWLQGSVSSSMRFYSGYFTQDNMDLLAQPNYVPTGLANFAHEISNVRREWAELQNKKLIYFSKWEKCGHFASLECPELFTDDLLSFISDLL